MAFQAVPKDLFFSRGDARDPRLGELFVSRLSEHISALPSGFCIFGYPDDEGISLNKGRPGAKLAPTEIRRALYKMTPHAFLEARPNGYDLGDLVVEGSLEKRHEVAQELFRNALQAGHRVITLGGGHDYGYADSAGFAEWAMSRGAKPVIINFDAHLDVREQGFTSGTPFFRLLTKYSSVDLLQVGIQPQCNSLYHRKWCEDRRVTTIPLERTFMTPLVNLVDEALTHYPEKHPLFISLDMDVFSSTVAPGASQSWPLGLEAKEFMICFKRLLQRFDVKALGVYEVSPPFDVDNRTSKWAAQIIHSFLFARGM